jgi:hypothetical protein
MNTAKKPFGSDDYMDGEIVSLTPGAFVYAQINTPADGFWLPNVAGLLLATEQSFTGLEFIMAYRTKTSLRDRDSILFISRGAVIHPKFNTKDGEGEALAKGTLMFSSSGYPWNEGAEMCSGLRNGELNRFIARAIKFHKPKLDELKTSGTMYVGYEKHKSETQ